MSNMDEHESLQAVVLQRLNEACQSLMGKGKSQQELASQLGISAQYLSDYRVGRRVLSELIARRIEEVSGFHWRWLLGRSDQEKTETPVVSAIIDVAPNTRTLLPVLPHPIEGEPRTHSHWDGLFAEIVGAPLTRLSSAKHPYLLKFGADDELRRLRKGDLVLMSQSILPETAAIESAIQVIRHGRGLYLARLTANGWKRLATSAPELLPIECTVHGYAVGIAWGTLF